MNQPVTAWGPADPTGEIRACRAGKDAIVIYEEGHADAFVLARNPVDIHEWA